MTEPSTADDFRTLVGRDFIVGTSADAVSLRLVDVRFLRPSPQPVVGPDGRPASRQQPFALDFVGPPSPVLSQRTYRFEDGDTAFDIFIVPLGVDRDVARYEAIFT